MTTATRRRKRARCSTCLTPLVKGSCPRHGPRNADGTSLTPSANRGRTFPADPLTREEVAALLKACSHRSPTGIRNKAMIATLWRSGVRCSELLDLRPKDVNRSAGQLRVLHGKGDKMHTPGIDDDALTLIDRWMTVRRELGITGHRPLFCTLWWPGPPGQRLSDRYMRAMTERLGRHAGLDRRVHPHAFRHTLAAEWEREGLSLTTIQQQLGHSAASVTSQYLRGLTGKEAADAARARPGWLAGMET